MALPLPVQVEPVQEPLPFAVGAEALILYPEDQAEDVETDSYLDSENIGLVTVYPSGLIFDPTIGTGGTEAQDCGDLQVVGVGGGGFVSVAGESTILFVWKDVASFFWWYPDGEPVDDTYVPPVQIEELNVPGVCAAPESAIGQLCPPSTIITSPGEVGEAPIRWDEEGAVWDGEGVWLS